ncbi:MAG: hypothetical protein HY471_02020 [Candidatus Sungbacteria bacterium]|nr:hypothetical protein [Candidatus Sungbacteria bacterium]
MYQLSHRFFVVGEGCYKTTEASPAFTLQAYFSFRRPAFADKTDGGDRRDGGRACGTEHRTFSRTRDTELGEKKIEAEFNYSP